MNFPILGSKISLIHDREDLLKRLSYIPNEPGCYLMKDNNDRILYVTCVLNDMYNQKWIGTNS